MCGNLDKRALLALCLLIVRRRRLRRNVVQENQALVVRRRQNVFRKNRVPFIRRSQNVVAQNQETLTLHQQNVAEEDQEPLTLPQQNVSEEDQEALTLREENVAEEDQEPSTRKGVGRGRAPRKWWVRPSLASMSARLGWKVFHNSLKEDPEKFRQHYQLPVKCFNDILAQIEKSITGTDTSMREAVDPETKLAATLRYLAQGGAYRQIAEDFHLGRSTVSIIVRSVCNAIWESLRSHYIGEPTVEQMLKISEDYRTKTDFPNCVGAVGGRYVDVSGYRQQNNLFKATSLGTEVLSKSLSLPEPQKVPNFPDPLPYVFVSKDFTLGEHVLRPFSLKLSLPERELFNCQLEKATAPFDSALKLLTSRWAVLQRPFEMAGEGVLERPALFDGIEEVTYKVLFVGKSGVGKTSVIASLAGTTPSAFRGDTLGIEVTDVYWPAKIWDKIIIFKIQCWEAGELSMKKYNHIVESCLDKVDLRVFVFSYNEPTSFSELPSFISLFSKQGNNEPASIVLGTRSSAKPSVSPSEIRTFKANYGLEIFPFTPNNSSKSPKDLQDLISLMNSICEILWLRDQHYIMNNSVTV